MRHRYSREVYSAQTRRFCKSFSIFIKSTNCIVSQFIYIALAISLWLTESHAIEVSQWDVSDRMDPSSTIHDETNTTPLTHSSHPRSNHSNCTAENNVNPKDYKGNSPAFVMSDKNNGYTNWNLNFHFNRPFKEGTSETFHFRLSSAPTSNVTVTIEEISINPGIVKFSGSSGNTLTYTMSNWCMVKEMTFEFLNDNSVDNSAGKYPRFKFKPEGGGINKGVDNSLNWYRLTDDEKSGGIVVEPSKLTMKEGETMPYDVRLTKNPNRTVVAVKVPTLGCSNKDVSHEPCTLTFTRHNWDKFQPIKVTAKRDGLTTNDRTIFYHLEVYHMEIDLDPPQVQITIENSEQPITASIELPEKISTTDKLSAKIKFSETVTEFDITDVTISGGTARILSGSGARYELPITPNGNTDVKVTVKKDAAKSGLLTGPDRDVSFTVKWDNGPPDVKISGVPPKINSTANFTATFTFSENVTEFDAKDVIVTGATRGIFSGSGRGYMLQLTPLESSDVVITVPANVATDGTDSGPAEPVSATAVWDTDAPEVTIKGLPKKINTTEPLTATFTFTDEVTGFETGDIIVDDGTKGALAGSGKNYTLIVTPTDGKDLKLTIKANSATDGLNTGPSNAVSATVVWDSDAPNVTITGLPKKINTTESLTATFNFTDQVTGFETDDVDVTGGIKGALAGNEKRYTLVVTPTDGKDLKVTIKANSATDGLNLGPPNAVSATVVWDSDPPNVSITGLPEKISTTNPLTAILTFSEEVTGFTTDDVTVLRGAKGAFTPNSAMTYTLGLQPSGAGDVTVTVARDAATDGVNTGPKDPVTFTSAWDGATPGVTISNVPEKINTRTPFTAIFTFSEGVTGFVASDVQVSGADKGAWSASSATTYMLSIRPLGNQNVVITVPANVATDGINSGPAEAVSAIAIWDATAPTVVIGGLPQRITAADPLTITFTFSEVVTGFISADVEVTSATKGTFTGTQKTYSLVMTPTGPSDIVVMVKANSATDGLNTGPDQDVTATAIWDPERVVTLTATSNQVLEGQPVELQVTLRGVPFASDKDIPLRYPQGAATEPADYTQLRSIKIEAGKNIGSGIIATRDDDVYEGDETFTVALGELPDGLTRGTPDAQTITIQQNDTPPPVETTLEVDKTTVNEGDQVRITAKIAGVLDYAVDVPLTYRNESAQDSDYMRVDTLKIPPMQKSAHGVISIKDDDLPENDEIFIVQLGRLSPTDLRSGNPSFQPITIKDRTTLPTADLSAEDVSEGENITVTLTLSRRVSSPVTIPLKLIPGTAMPEVDYEIPPSLDMTVAVGDSISTLIISTLDDQLLEPDETLRIGFGEPPPTVKAGGAIVVTITDDTMPEILMAPSIAVVEGGSNMVDVSLSAAPRGRVIVTMRGYSAPLNAPSPPQLTFTPQDYDQPQRITLTAEADQNSVNEERMLLLTANGGGYVSITKQLRVTITDRDVPQLVVQSPLTVPEGGTATLSLSLASAPMSQTTVTLEGNQNPKLTWTPQRLTFSTIDWKQPKYLTFQAEEDDNFVDEPQQLVLRAQGYANQDVTSPLQVTIDDNDQPDLKVSTSTLTIQEGKTGQFQVALNGQPSNDVMVSFSAHQGLRPPPNLTFLPARWKQRQTVTLEALDDDDFENEEFELILTANGGDYKRVTKTIQITIEDNDTPPQPVLVSINDHRVTEDEKKVQLNVELSRATEEVVTVQYQSSDLTAQAGSDYTASRGLVIFDPQATRGIIQFDINDDEDPEGAETFEVTLSDPTNARLGRATGTVTILDPNPVSIVRIEDAVIEGDAMNFEVHIVPPSAEAMMLRYQTEDGTAKAGEDYQAMSGLLEIAPAVETMMIEVPLLGAPLQPETFRVRLETSDPIKFEKAVATATITEDAAPRVGLSEAIVAYTARFMRVSASEIIEGLQQRLKNQSSACSAASRHETARLWHSVWQPSLSELLSGCHMTSTRGSVQVWGRGAYRRFSGQEEADALRVEADVSTAMAGADYRWRSGWVTGVLVSHSRSDGAYEIYDLRDWMDASMTGIYPYLSYQTKTWGMWGTGGLARGQTETIEQLEGSWQAGFGAMGLQGTMAMVKAFRLRYYGDVMTILTELEHRRVGVTRIRAGMEASAHVTSGFHPYVDAGFRQDAGSAENGVGLEVGAGMRVAIPALRLKGDLRTQSLIVHTAEGFTEWGISGSLEVGSQHQGLGLRVKPSWGPHHRRGLYTQQTIQDATATQEGTYRTETELGYGIPFKKTVIRSVMGVTTFDQGAMYRLGGELRSWGAFSVSAFGIVHAHATGSQNIGMNIQGLIQY